jgi:hypothetical protein
MEAILALPAVERYTRQAATDAMAAFVDPGDQAEGRKTTPGMSLTADHVAADMLLPAPLAPNTAPNKQPLSSVLPPVDLGVVFLGGAAAGEST